MSYNKLINAVIALIEDRPADARKMLRSPEAKFSIGDVQNRLFVAVKNRENVAMVSILKNVLRASLRIDSDIPDLATAHQREAFLMGVAAVEQIVENYLELIR